MKFRKPTMKKLIAWRKRHKKPKLHQTETSDGQTLLSAAGVPLPKGVRKSISESSDTEASSQTGEIPFADVAELASLIPLPQGEGSDSLSIASASSVSTVATEFQSHGTDNESYALLKSRVLALARFYIWPGTDRDLISVDTMDGGEDAERLVAVHRGAERFVVRISWLPQWSNVIREIAAIQWCQRTMYIPIPEIISFDETSKNCLESPYIIERISPGVSYVDSYKRLDQDQKRQFAKELGNVYRQMTEVTSSHAGYVVFPSGEWSMQFHVAPFHPEHNSKSFLHRDRAPGLSVKDLMLSLFEAQAGPGTKVGGMVDIEIFRVLISELEERGWMKEMPTCLARMQLGSTDVLVNPRARPGKPLLSAVLGCKDVFFAPAFMSCSSPSWLWDLEEDDQPLFAIANREPASPEGKKLKKIFDKAAGDVYRRFAYEVPYHILRRLMTFAITGFGSWSEEKGVIALCDVWIRYMATKSIVSHLVGLTPLVALQEAYNFEYFHYWPPHGTTVPGF